MLRFMDGVKISVIGLDEIMADLYTEGREANKETAGEIIKRLEALNNHIPESDSTRKEYAYVLLTEYREYAESQTGKNR